MTDEEIAKDIKNKVSELNHIAHRAAQEGITVCFDIIENTGVNSIVREFMINVKITKTLGIN